MAEVQDRARSDTRPINREHWLALAVEEVRPLFADAGYKLARVRVSVGWPSTSALSLKAPRHGEAWTDEHTPDGVSQLFISPILAEPSAVLGMLMHELGHVVCGKKAGHRGPYVRYMVALGLVGKPTHATPGDELQAKLDEVAERLGEYPHTAIQTESRTKQGTRLLKVMCWECGYTIRVTQTWIDEGLPTCPCGALMNEGNPPADDEPEGERDERLQPAGTSLRFVTNDERFEVLYTKEALVGSGLSGGKKERATWNVIDHNAPGGTPRTTKLATRHDTLGFIEAVREGVYKYPPLEARDFDDALLDPAHFDYLPDDEPEELDNPDDDPGVVFERECDELRRLRPTWSDERIEREARRRMQDVYPEPESSS